MTKQSLQIVLIANEANLVLKYHLLKNFFDAGYRQSSSWHIAPVEKTEDLVKRLAAVGICLLGLRSLHHLM